MKAFLALAFLMITAPAAAAITTEAFIDNGRPLKLSREAMLGQTQAVEGCFVVRSAKPGANDEFGSHYISIGLLADALLAPGDYHVTARLGLKRTSPEPSPVMLSVKIGRHWHDLAFADGRVTVQGVLLDAVRYDRIEIDHAAPVRLDGQPFTLEFVRKDGLLQILIDGGLLQQFWIEPSGGDLGLCVERKQLLRVATSTNDIEAELRVYQWKAAAEFQARSEDRRRWESLAGSARRLMKRIGDAYAYVEDDPRLPNVLIIGDSISIYYTDPVRRLLAGRADVYRTPVGPGKAETLFASLDQFLKNRRWDIIHFNSGLHDFAGKEGTSQQLSQYRRNLEIILGKLRATGARVIWASTTPVPAKVPARASSDVLAQRYNAAAKALMDEEGVPIDDLYAAILPHHDKYWLAPNNIHFNQEGSAFLGRKVANAILAELDRAK
jgi:acyl-CoA thioesterase-1